MVGDLVVTPEQLAAARKRGPGWVAFLAEELQCDETRVCAAIASVAGLPAVTMTDLLALVPTFEAISLTKAQARQCLLLREPGDDVLVGVVTDPWDDDTLCWAETRADAPIRWSVCAPEELRAMLSRLEASARATDTLSGNTIRPGLPAKVSETLTLAGSADAESPAVQLVNSALYDALKVGASDIHLECTADGLAVKYRIDGVLDTVATVAGTGLAEQAISRLKVLSELDIAERRIPQDGSFRVSVQQRDIDLRVSIMPSVHGEDAVVRVLDKHGMVDHDKRLDLQALGFDSVTVKRLSEMFEAAYGMLLVTGPTGSGKTTTLYAALSEIHTGRDKIVTIEDPVEYRIDGILQVPVNEKKGLTFARGLRSILRHDPDKIMVGEIRDRETAEIAVQAALTGHLVLSTVHANSVFDVFGRFTHMGLDTYSLVSALNGVWAQRLLRINCADCSRTYEPSDEELLRFGLNPQGTKLFKFSRGQGCGKCRGTGYRGRRAIAELLVMTDEIREQVVARQPVRALRETARANGTTTLSDAALRLVAEGQTTLEEVRRVTLSG